MLSTHWKRKWSTFTGPKEDPFNHMAILQRFAVALIAHEYTSASFLSLISFFFVSGQGDCVHNAMHARSMERPPSCILHCSLEY